ncbi:MAG TPA: carboxypeptidase-like regulatory domain-containing protein [Bacteroidia bacterium]|nr:carboxypeptidase-like regulatory domain-containing protein [Bacteroidia bacterium]
MKKLSLFLALISLAILFIFSCKKEKNDAPSVNYGSSNSLRTTVSGIVLDESNAPLSGVTVTAYGQTTTTSQNGTFVLKNINANKNRCVLQFSKAGFFNRAQGFIASANTVKYIRIILLSNAATQNFSSSAGGTVSLPDGSSAAFQPNSFVTSNGSAYTGTVNLIVKHLSPDDVNFGFTIPGGDLAGINASNENVVLYSYGMLGIELTGSSGEALQLATGTSATLTMTIAASQLSSAPASIPLWYFDETTSLWKEEGSANKVGNNYVGTVSHFSWWNYDYQGPRAYIKGRVVDCLGAPLPNIHVTVNGFYVTTTDQNGEFYEAFPCGMTFTIQVLASNNSGIVSNSQVITVPALSPNQVYTIPDLVVSCITRVAGMLKTCSGEITDGLVTLTDNSGFNNYQYTTNGNFNLIAVPNTQIDLYAFSSTASHFQNLTSLSPPAVLNVGAISLCDTFSSASTANSFTLVGSPFPHHIFNITTSSAYAQVTDTFSFGFTNVLITGTAPPNYTISYFHISIYDTIPVPTVCDVYIELIDQLNLYEINSDNVSCHLTEIGAIGDQVKGTFSGSVVTTGNGSTTYGNISGSFDVIRTQ